MVLADPGEVSCSRPNSIGRSRLTTRPNRPTFNLISGASRAAWSCVGYALYTTHERPFFFNQSIFIGENVFRFEANSPLSPAPELGGPGEAWQAWRRYFISFRLSCARKPKQGQC